jgi:putative effector of murein hydrolase LrgA (UPF0299 family)
MIWPLAILLGCQLAGEIIVKAVAIPVPGPVLGMVILLALLMTIPRLKDLMVPVTQTILGNLSLLFVPAGVGVVAHLDKVVEFGVGLLVALVLSTLLSLTAAVLTFRLVARALGDRP